MLICRCFSGCIEKVQLVGQAAGDAGKMFRQVGAKFADCLSGERPFATSLSRTVIQAVRINTITEKSIIRADLPPSMKKDSHHGEQ